MKKIIILIISIIFLQASIAFAQAQFRTDSNTVTTRIGNPPTAASSCPVSGGRITCGSKNVPVNGCGHCGTGYEAYMKECKPGYEGILYAMDIAGSDFQNIILPSVNGKVIRWSFVRETNRIDPPVKGAPQAIQLFSGTDATTGEKYWIQFHHTAPDSGNREARVSGDVGAQICGSGCGMGHVHVEFAKIDTSGAYLWQDAPNYFCK